MKRPAPTVRGPRFFLVRVPPGAANTLPQAALRMVDELGADRVFRTAE
jgi:hypothetical protein